MTHIRYTLRRWVREWKIRKLLKWDQRCTYCTCDLDRIPNSPRQLTIDHWIPKSRGGSDRLSNLCLACAVCNRRKGSMSALRYMESAACRARTRSVIAERYKP